MSAAANQWLKRQRFADANLRTVVRVLVTLHRDGADIYPSQAWLARETELCRKSVQRCLDLLEYFGVIVRTKRSNGRGGRTSDRYQLALKRDFDLTVEGVAAVRAVLRQPVSKATMGRFGEKLQSDHGSVAKRPWDARIEAEVKNSPIQEEDLHGLDSSTEPHARAARRGRVPTPAELADNSRFPIRGRA